jgi:hypothetical protein
VESPRFRLLACAGRCISIAAACATVGASTTAACTTHQCDTGPNITVPTDMSSIHVDGDQVVWESAPLAGPWGDFLGQRIYVFPFPMPFQPTDVVPTVSIDRDPAENFTVAAGQLAELSHLTTDGVTVLNATCQEYFLRVVVRGTLLPAHGAAQASDSSIDDGNQAQSQDGSVDRD